MLLEGRQLAAFKLYNLFMSLLDKTDKKHHQCAATLIGMEPLLAPLAYFLRANPSS